MEDKMLLFEHFCQNVQININNKRSIANGVQYMLSANGLNANKNIYNNWNTYSQGAESFFIILLGCGNVEFQYFQVYLLVV